MGPRVKGLLASVTQTVWMVGVLLRGGRGARADTQERFEVPDDLGHGGEAIGGALGEHLHHDRRELLGNGRDARVRRLDAHRRVHLEHIISRLRGQRGLAGEEVVERRAQGVDVCAGIDGGGVFGLLGGHERGGAHRCAAARDTGCARVDRHTRHRIGLFEFRLRRAVRVVGLHQPEVRDLHQPLIVEQQVGGLHISVHHLVLVGIGEPARGVQRIRHGLLGRQRALALDDVRQRLAQHILHTEVVLVLLVADIVDLDDVVVRELRDREGLTHESREKRRAARELGRDGLHRDVPVQRELPGEVDTAHAASAKLAQKLIPIKATQRFAVGIGVLHHGWARADCRLFVRRPGRRRDGRHRVGRRGDRRLVGRGRRDGGHVGAGRGGGLRCVLLGLVSLELFDGLGDQRLAAGLARNRQGERCPAVRALGLVDTRRRLQGELMLTMRTTDRHPGNPK